MRYSMLRRRNPIRNGKAIDIKAKKRYERIGLSLEEFLMKNLLMKKRLHPRYDQELQELNGRMLRLTVAGWRLHHCSNPGIRSKRQMIRID